VAVIRRAKRTTRDLVVNLRMNEAEAARLRAVAAYMGLDASSTIRHLITEAHRAVERGAKGGR
jgi:antitoxin component of RelBE/YafQ-DinJ toxin-antitoxin module